MQKFKKKKIAVEEAYEIKCDWCSKTGVPFGVQTRGKKAFCGGTVSFSFGYPSRHDSEDYKLDICDDCFEKHFKKMAKGNLAK